MLSDRFYMRGGYDRKPLTALAWIICIIAASFVVENVLFRWFGGHAGGWLLHFGTLAPETISKGFVWTVFTYSLFHNPDDLVQLLFVLLWMYSFGRDLQSQIGERRLLGLFLGSIGLGGVVWLAVNWTHGGLLFGASASVSAFIVLLACLEPDRPIMLFFTDIGLSMKHLAIALLVIDLLGLALLEIPGRTSWFSMAHSAHLGGMLAGWLYFRFIHQHGYRDADGKTGIELPRWFKKAKKATAPAPVYQVNLSSRETLRVEVDRILDKINSEGFASLTQEEKHLLDNAKDMLSRR